MQLPPNSVIEERLMKMFQNTRPHDLARGTRLIQRAGGKLKVDVLFWSLAIGFFSGNYRSLEEDEHEYLIVTESLIADLVDSNVRRFRRRYRNDSASGNGSVRKRE